MAGEAPVLLLDDVLSELDAERSAAFLAGLEGLEQVFVTTTHASERPLRGATTWRIEAAQRVAVLTPLARAVGAWTPGSGRSKTPAEHALGAISVALAGDRRRRRCKTHASAGTQRRCARCDDQFERVEQPVVLALGSYRVCAERGRNRGNRASAFPDRTRSPRSHRHRCERTRKGSRIAGSERGRRDLDLGRSVLAITRARRPGPECKACGWVESMFQVRRHAAGRKPLRSMHDGGSLAAVHTRATAHVRCAVARF